MPLDNLNRDGRGTGPAQPLQSIQQRRPAPCGGQPDGSIRTHIPAKRPQVFKHALRVLPGQLQTLGIHHWIGKTSLDQCITEVMQIGQRRKG